MSPHPPSQPFFFTIHAILLLLLVLLLLPALSFGWFFRAAAPTALPKPNVPLPPPPPPPTTTTKATYLPRMSITGIAAPFSWRRKVLFSQQHGGGGHPVTTTAAPTTTGPPTRASDRQPFSLAKAVLLGPFAFEVYKDPAREEGCWQLGADDNDMAILDDGFKQEMYAGEVRVRVLSVCERKAAGNDGAATSKLGPARQEGWLANLLGFKKEGNGAKGPASTNVALGVTMGRECVGTLPFGLVETANTTTISHSAPKAAKNYMALAKPAGDDAVAFTARLKRPSSWASPPPTSMNVTLASEDRGPLGTATIDISSLLQRHQAEGEEKEEEEEEVREVTSYQVVPLMSGEEDGPVMMMEVELAWVPFKEPKPEAFSEPLWLPVLLSSEDEVPTWHGPKGCSRDWRELACNLGGDAVTGKDMKLLCFVENRATDAQVKVWRDDKRKRLIVSFRGTDPTRLADIVTDLKLLQEPWDLSELDKPLSSAALEEQAWMTDLSSSLAWQANVTGMVFNELASSLHTATSYWDYAKRVVEEYYASFTAPSAPTSVESQPPPTTKPRRRPAASPSPPAAPISLHAIQLLQPPLSNLNHRLYEQDSSVAGRLTPQQPLLSTLPNAFTAPALGSSPSSPQRTRRRDLVWSSLSSRSTQQEPQPRNEPSAVDQAVAAVFTSVLDKVLRSLDPASAVFQQREGGMTRSALDFRNAFKGVVNKAAEHLGSQVLTTWDEMESTAAAADGTAAVGDGAHQPLDLLVLIGQAGSSPLVMLPTRFREVFDSLVNETLRAMDEAGATLTSSRLASTGRDDKASKRSRLVTMLFKPLMLRFRDGVSEHPSQSDFRLGLSKALDQVLTSLQEKQVGAFSASLPDSLRFSPESFGVSPLPRVHSGFKEAYLSVRPRLLDLLQIATKGRLEEDGWEVMCTGHSMGGALATLMAHELSERFPANRITMYSFGQPKTGNTAFAERYNRVNGDSYRVVNEYDAIARFPRALNASVFNYLHAGKTVLPNYKPDGSDGSQTTTLWVEGEQEGLCPLRDLNPRAPGSGGSREGGGSSLPANLSPVFLAAEWSLLNSFVTGAALSNHLEYRYLESLENSSKRRSPQAHQGRSTTANRQRKPGTWVQPKVAHW